MPKSTVILITALLLTLAVAAVGIRAGAESRRREPGRAEPASEEATVVSAESADEETDENDGREWDARVSVIAELPESTAGPLGASSTVLHPSDGGRAVSRVADLAVESPGVSENGQGGHFQVFSIRGVSRHRVMSLVSGMRVHSERRAGASVSFLDPFLMDSVEVLRGSSTTFHGSGALGGVVRVLPRTFDGWSMQGGYDSAGDENFQAFGYGAQGWSVGLARRDAGDSDAADGTLLNGHFTQFSATLMRNWERGARRYELLYVPARAENIGKPNTDFPDRTTEYPSERHDMLEFRVESERDWRAGVWLHDHRLETEVVEAGGRSRVLNDSFDFGAKWEKTEHPRDALSVRWGLQVDGRADVDAEEIDQTDSGAFSQRPLDGANELETGVFAALHIDRARTGFEVGGRLSDQRQDNAGFDDERQSAVNGFVGVTRRIGGNSQLRGSVSSGLRFPNLSERFFSGTTGAGGIVGNPELDPERSLSAEVSLRRLGRKSLLSAAVYRTEIDDYVERVATEADPDILTFRNLTSGTLQGGELQVMFHLAEPWRLELGGHLARGRDDDGRPLADVPVHRIHAELRRSLDRWTIAGRLTHRGSKTDPAGTERRRSSADVLSLAVTRELAAGWSLALTGSNLLDEEYFLAADEKAPLAVERSFGFRLVREGP